MQRLDCHSPISPLFSHARMRVRARMRSLHSLRFALAHARPRTRARANFGNFRAA